MDDFNGKVAFVTGGGSGIGLSIAKAMAKRGAKVMLADISTEKLRSAEDALKAEALDVATVICDAGNEQSLRDAADATIKAFGKVHIVVNNAGVGLGGQAGHIPTEDWRWITDINLHGVAFGVEIFAPLMLSHGEGGHFVNTASMAGHVAMPGMSPYHATKFAVVGYSESIRQDFEGQGIGVSVLCPAWVKTEIYKSTEAKPSGYDPASANSPAAEAMRSYVLGGIDPDLVGEWTADCVQANRLYIFTHPEMREHMQDRHARMMADYDAAIASDRFQHG